MQLQEATLDSGLWEDGNGVSVEYSLEVIQDLRRLSVDGFNAFARGGKEIGGALYGKRRQSGVAVLACAELECEHALGPRFLLSGNDHAAMARLMEPHEGLEVVGWFRAHTRSGLELDAHDRELFDRYFEHPMSVSLVLKPTRWGPATATFYVRDACGVVGPESVREFAIELPRRALVETLSTAAEAPPASPAPAAAALVALEPAAAAAALPAARESQAVSQSARRSWPWAMCAGVLLGAVITIALQSLPSRQVHANPAPPASPAGDVRVATTAGGAEPVPAAVAPPQPVMTPRAAPPPPRKAEIAEIKPAQREAHIPPIVSATPPPQTYLPAPPAASLHLAPAPESLPIALNPVLSIAPPPAVTARAAAQYNGPRIGRLIWAGDLAHLGVFEMDGSRVSPGSLTGAMPHVPLALHVMPAEFGRDGLTVFTSEPQRDNKTEPPSQSNGWNSLHFKLDAVRARELVLLESPNAANGYARFAVRNDGRPCSLVLMEWHVE